MKLRKILSLSILSEQANVIRAKAGEETKNYVVQKKVEVTKTVTIVYDRIEDGDKENKEDIIVYRSNIGKIRRGKPVDVIFFKILRCASSGSISFPAPTLMLSYLSS